MLPQKTSYGYLLTQSDNLSVKKIERLATRDVLSTRIKKKRLLQKKFLATRVTRQLACLLTDIGAPGFLQLVVLGKTASHDVETEATAGPWMR